jgi:hypothetical protein
MSTSVNPRHLRRLLERLRDRESDRHAACADALKQFSPPDWLVLGGWVLAAAYGPSGGKLRLESPDVVEVADSWGAVMFRTRFSPPRSPEQPILIDAPLVPASSAPGSAPEDVPSLRQSFESASLVWALQLIHDHLDSTLLKVREVRDEEIAQFADSVGLQADVFRRLAAWEPQLSPYLRWYEHADRH